MNPKLEYGFFIMCFNDSEFETRITTETNRKSARYESSYFVRTGASAPVLSNLGGEALTSPDITE